LPSAHGEELLKVLALQGDADAAAMKAVVVINNFVLPHQNQISKKIILLCAHNAGTYGNTMADDLCHKPSQTNINIAFPPGAIFNSLVPPQIFYLSITAEHSTHLCISSMPL